MHRLLPLALLAACLDRAPSTPPHTAISRAQLGARSITFAARWAWLISDHSQDRGHFELDLASGACRHIAAPAYTARAAFVPVRARAIAGEPYLEIAGPAGTRRLLVPAMTEHLTWLTGSDVVAVDGTLVDLATGARVATSSVAAVDRIYATEAAGLVVRDRALAVIARWQPPDAQASLGTIVASGPTGLVLLDDTTQTLWVVSLDGTWRRFSYGSCS